MIEEPLAKQLTDLANHLRSVVGVDDGHIDLVREARDDNELLRELLWLRHDAAHAARLYGDDGEMQCVQCLIDFKRMPAEDIKRVWSDEGRRKLILAANAPSSPSKEQVLTSLLRQAYNVGGWEINVDHPKLAAEILEALKRFP